jgi:L-seryl-tRNA(Ser) seleniumtransferase
MGVVEPGELQRLLRQLPSVDRILGGGAAEGWLASYPRALVVGEIRAALEQMRQRIASGQRVNGQPAVEALVAEATADAGRRLEQQSRPSLRRVINASGVILHTNLGRAPLSGHAVEAVASTAGGYTNLEYDLVSGRRGKRDLHAAGPLEKLLGAPAIVVNNNAAAILLVLSELAAGGEVLVSRGELIEIGDGFRIPDIMASSGARLREVGTTNRTRTEDYRDAIGEQTRLLLRVHPSNFRIVGFTARPALDELVALARQSGLPLVEDLGSGCLYDFATLGLRDEPPVTASLAAGVDLVTFSGDKLLGGPQAGLVAGRESLIRRMRRNPLFRALRADKLAYAALEATLRDYLFERWDEIPVLRMARETAGQVRARAARFVEALGGDFPGEVELLAGESVLGGGSTPGQGLPTTLLAIAPKAMGASELEQHLRQGDPAVIARLEKDRILLDLRTVSYEDELPLAKRLQESLDRRPPKAG